jgi:amino acid transporter
MNHDPVKQAWQASVEIAGAPPLEEVRKGADKFYRYIKWRNIVEYVACVVAVVVFTIYFFTMPHILHKIGSALLVAASIYAPWQLHRRASAVAPETAGAMPIYDFLRGQLVRQRDALKTILGWYVLPFVPGMVLFIAGNGLDPEVEAAGPPIWVRWAAIAGIFSVFGFVWWINQLGARRLQKRIDEIDALTGRTE